jgi:MscS family membrane protein
MQGVLDFLGRHEYISDGLISALILFATFFVGKFVSKIESFIFLHVTRRTKTDLDDKILDVLGSTTRKIITLAGIYFALHNLDSLLSVTLMKYGDGILYVLTVFVLARLLSGILQMLLDWYGERWGKSVKGRIQDEFDPLFRRLIVIVVYTIAVVFILKNFKQDISSILVSLGVGSLAVALAAKDTLANMISGFMIMTDRPFRIGDRIMLESGEKGDVYDIGLRSTKILTFDNTLIVVPNQQIINEKVTNLSYPDPQIRVMVEVGVAYGTDLDRAKKILVDICNDHPDVLEEPPPKAFFLNFGDSSLDLRVVCRVAQWSDQWRVGEELRVEIKKVLEREGIEIPFPQRVVYMKKEDD